MKKRNRLVRVGWWCQQGDKCACSRAWRLDRLDDLHLPQDLLGEAFLNINSVDESKSLHSSVSKTKGI